VREALNIKENDNGFELTIPLLEVTPKKVVVHDVVHDLNNTEQKILEALLKPKSTPELLTHLGYKTRTRNYEMAIKQMLKYALLEMTIPDKPRSKNQKYRLTQKGKQTLKNSNGI